MRVLFLMDPINTVIRDEDTSFAMIQAFEAAGHQVFHALPQALIWRDAELYVDTSAMKSQPAPADPLHLDESERLQVADFDALFIRKDPPFDENYLWMSLLLEHVRGRVLFVNDPRGLREANEKLYTAHFAKYMPKSLVSSSASEIGDFVDSVGGNAVIKPIDGHGGDGVFSLSRGDKNYNAIIEHVTRLGKRAVMVQELIPEVKEGDKRILLLDGEVLGAILRVPQGGDLRSNIHVGGSVQPATVTEREHDMIKEMAPRLRQDGLIFVGLDVIGEKLTEVNVTSPTGIQQMTRFDNEDYSARVVRWTESNI